MLHFTIHNIHNIIYYKLYTYNETHCLELRMRDGSAVKFKVTNSLHLSEHSSPAVLFETSFGRGIIGSAVNDGITVS